MTFRLPQNLQRLGPEAGLGEFDREVLAEKAASLGRTGKALERRMADLRACADPAERPALAQAAADAAHALMIQRELCGLLDHRAVIADFGLPGEVVVRIGVSTPR